MSSGNRSVKVTAKQAGFKQRKRGITALIVLLALVLALSSSGSGISFLGDLNAARPAAANAPAGAILPRSGVPVVSLLDTALPTSAGPQTVADAQAASLG